MLWILVVMSYIIPLLLRKAFVVKMEQEHSGPESWAKQTVGTITLLQRSKSKLLI